MDMAELDYIRALNTDYEEEETMSNINLIALSGRIGQDPEMKYFESGSVKSCFSIAVNRWDKQQNKEVADWFNVEVWGKQAEFVGEYAKKGSRVFVEGSLRTSSYTTESGENKTRTYINASNIEVIKEKETEK